MKYYSALLHTAPF